MSKRLELILKKIILIILISPLIFTFYKSEIIYKSELHGYYFKYYIISSVLCFYAIVIYLKNCKFLIYNLIILPSILISLYLFQGYEIQFKKYLISKEFFEKTGKEFDAREIFEVYEDRLSKGEKVTVWVPPKYFTKKKN